MVVEFDKNSSHIFFSNNKGKVIGWVSFYININSPKTIQTSSFGEAHIWHDEFRDYILLGQTGKGIRINSNGLIERG
jgi:hypothetical protein